MVESEDIERAEKVLQIHYGTGSVDRQLEGLQVEQAALDGFMLNCTTLIKRRYTAAWHDMDPRIEPAFNTALYHAFMTGLLVGRGERRRIE